MLRYMFFLVISLETAHLNKVKNKRTVSPGTPFSFWFRDYLKLKVRKILDTTFVLSIPIIILNYDFIMTK